MDRAMAILKAVSEATRLRAIALLAEGELTVTELVQALGQSQPRVSRHLKLLAEAGVVERLPEGAWVFYRLSEDDKAARAIAEAAIAAVPGDDSVRARDFDRLRGVKAARAEAAAEYFRSVARDWSRIRALHQPEAEVEAAMLAAAGPGPFSFLVDIGTGTGRMLEVFSDRVRRGVGIDLNNDMLALARHNLEQAGLKHCSVRRADLFALPFEQASADLVTVHQVLHFLPDPAAAVAEAARIVRPGGRLVIVDFAPHNLEFLREQHAHRRLGFSDDEMGGWVRAAGLTPGPARALVAGDEGLTVTVWTAVQERARHATKHLQGDAA